jgi:hypothetical protein
MLIDTNHTIFANAADAAKIAAVLNADDDDDFTYQVVVFPNGKAVVEAHDEAGVVAVY